MQLISTCKTLQNVTDFIHSFIDINLVLIQSNSKHPKIDCFEYTKQSLLKSNLKNITSQIFISEKIPESKISKPKNPSIISVASLANPEHLPWARAY